MKSYIVVCALLVGANALTKEQFEKAMVKVQAIGAACGEKEHASEDDMAKLMDSSIPTSHEGKCTVACFYEHFKVLKADGTFDKEAAVHAFNELKAMDLELHAKVLKIIDTCYEKRQIVDDRCETATLMAICAKTEAEGMGLTKEAFLASDD